MKTRRLAAVALALALALALASVVSMQASAASPQISDDCGDAGSGLRAMSQSVAVDDFAASRDIRSARVGVVGRAVQGTIRACGPVSPATSYYLTWGLRDGCWMGLGYAPRRLADRVITAQVEVREWCPSGDTTPVVGGQAREVSRVALHASAAVFRGNDVTITVPLSKVPSASQPRFRKGTMWPTTYALAGDPDLIVSFYTIGTLPHSEVSANARFDWAFGRGYTVGER